MGQGDVHRPATLVAEELDADWQQVRVEGAPADAKRYNNLAFGDAGHRRQFGASPTRMSSLRKAGATARAMLVAAAAGQWEVTRRRDDDVAKGVVHHAASEPKATFGELRRAAARLPVPDGRSS